MKDRIAQLLIEEGLTASRFAEIVGVQPSGISHILSGRNKPGYELIIKILGNFPYINPDWLLLGVGEMFREGAETSHRQPNLFDNRNRQPLEGNSTGTSSTVSSIPSEKKADSRSTEESIFGFTLDETTQEPVTLTKIPDLFNTRDQIDAEIERVMIFYSDNTVSTYKVKK